MSPEEARTTEERADAIAAAAASLRLGQSLGQAALEAVAAGVDEQTFVNGARDTFRQIKAVLQDTADEMQRLKDGAVEKAPEKEIADAGE
jgi:uncharacterized protein (DUF1778 family)